jgi:hypothetical protein
VLGTESIGPELGAALGNKLGSVLGIVFGTELGTALGSELGPAPGTPLGRPLGTEVLGIGVLTGAGVVLSIGLLLGVDVGLDVPGAFVGTDVGGVLLHFCLHSAGQKNLTFFPVIGSFSLHRWTGFFETHAQPFFSLFLKRKISQFSHFSRFWS